jgi:D-alanine-D-alanine ligase
MDILILHQEVSDELSPQIVAAEEDVLVQVHAVRQALQTLGHTVSALSCTLNLKALHDRLREHVPDLVFNLVESLGGHDVLGCLVPSLLDALKIAYTGTPAHGLFLLADKLIMKQWLRAHGLPVPDWWSPRSEPNVALEPGTYLIKTVSQHASFGIEDHSVLDVTDTEALPEAVAATAARLGHECFAERYIEGREFNLSLLASSSTDGRTVDVLPPAEIVFDQFPPHQPRIVGYRAKWEEGSLEYQRTPRRFCFPPEDRQLLERLQSLARRCWQIFGMGGYGRVDFRVDTNGNPWILEVNANPCLSPDAGFAAALKEARITFEDAIARIVHDAVCRTRVSCTAGSASQFLANRNQ